MLLLMKTRIYNSFQKCFDKITLQEESARLSCRNAVQLFLSELDTYLSFLQMMNKRIKKLKKYDKYLQLRLNKHSVRMLSRAFNLEKNIPNNFKQRVRELFREVVKDYIFQSKMLKRYYEKPRGYPGDFLMFEALYDNRPLSSGIGYYFDKFVLDYPLAKSVVKRKDKMKQLLADMIRKNNVEILEVLNIGSGSAREVREMLRDNSIRRKINLTFCDQDSLALKFIRNNMPRYGENIEISLLKGHIINMIGLGPGISEIKFKRYDIIYSLGVVDYFFNNTLKRFVQSCYGMLKPGGTLIIASCSSRVPHIYLLLTWFCDWNFYARNASITKEFLSSGSKNGSIKFQWEPYKNIFFIIVTKPK